MSSSYPASNHHGQNERPKDGSSSNISFPSDTHKFSQDYMGQLRYSTNHDTLPPAAGNQLPSGMGMRDMYTPSYPPSIMSKPPSPSPYNTSVHMHSNRLSMEFAQLPLRSPLHHNNGSMEDMRYQPGMMDLLRQQGESLYPRSMSMDPIRFPTFPISGMHLSMSMSSPFPSASAAFSPPRRSFAPGLYPAPPGHLMLPKVDSKESGESSPMTSLSEEGLMMEKRPPKKISKKRAAPTSSFPTKLHKILSTSDCNEYIDWLPHGRAFRILKAKGFEEHVLPRFFRSSRYASFMRQINGWGFKRITEGPDLNAYYHEMFLRGLADVCVKMVRPLKGSFTANDFGECPDFYKISMLAPLPDPDGPSDSEDDDERRQGKKPRAKTKRPQSWNSDQANILSTREMGQISSRASPVNRSDSASFGMAVRSPDRAHASLSSTVASPSPSSDSNILLPFTPLSRELSLGDFGTSSGQETLSLSSWGSNKHDMLMFDSFENSRAGGQVTPPGSSFFPKPPAVVSSSAGRSQHDSRGLSVADLCYLTQQNRILLDQVKKRQTDNVA